MCGFGLKGDIVIEKKKRQNKEKIRKNFIQGKINEYEHDKDRK